MDDVVMKPAIILPTSLVMASSHPQNLFALTIPSGALSVGAFWMLSSAIWTTYSTSTFLKQQSLPSVTSNINADLPTSHPFPLLMKAQQQLLRQLSVLPRTTLLTLYRFAGSLCLGLLLHWDWWNLLQRIETTLINIPPFVLPAFFLFVANYSNTISLNRVGISLTYTSKCGIPVMTALLSLIFDGRQSLPKSKALLSLLPIVAGIGMASWNSPTFETTGFVAALISTAAQSALSITSKRVMAQTGLTGLAAQRSMVAVSLILVLFTIAGQHLHQHLLAATPSKMATLEEPPHTPSRNKVLMSPIALPSWWLSLMAVMAYHLEYVLSFMFVKLVQPITYGACDAVRRLAIILTGRALFGGPPLTRLNRVGIALALTGALAYSITNI